MSPRIRMTIANAATRGAVPTHATLGGMLVAFAASFSSASAQDAIKMAVDEPTCHTCFISVDSIVTIGGLHGPGLEVIDDVSRVAVDRMGRIIVSLYRYAEISVFDSTGTFLRAFGRWGEGPGEYQFVDHVNAGPRYIHVIDISGRTVLDYDFEFVRRDQFGIQGNYSHVLDPEDVAFTGVVPTRASAGHPLHVLRLSGEMESFGGRGPVVGDPGWDGWPVTGGGEALWVLEGGESNRLSRWDLTAKPRSRTYEWKKEEYDLGNVKLDHRGLWVTWRSPAGGRRLDLVDPATGTTIARSSGDVVGTFVEGTGSIYLKHYHESDAGIPYITLFRINLSHPPGS